MTALASHARGHGVLTVFPAYAGEAVARIYVQPGPARPVVLC